MKMNKAEALRIGTVIADRWWKYNKPTILNQQHIDKQKDWQHKKDRPATAIANRQHNKIT